MAGSPPPDRDRAEEVIHMRNWGVILAVLLGTVLTAWARKEETLEALKSRAESAKVADRPGICTEIAERQLDAAHTLYTDGKAEQARAAIDDVVLYSERAGDAAATSGKKLKHTEIVVRKMAHKLRDLKRTLSFEDQSPVQNAIDRLEHVRTDLLSKMFGVKGEK